MRVARAILALIALFAVGATVWAWHYDCWQYLITFIASVFFLAAMTVLAATYLQWESKNGQFIVDRDSLWGKLLYMGYSYTEEDPETKQEVTKLKKITICSLFWYALGVIFVSLAGVVTVGVCVVFLAHVIRSAFAGQLGSDAWALLWGPLVVLGYIGGFVLCAGLFNKGKKKIAKIIPCLLIVCSLTILGFLFVQDAAERGSANVALDAGMGFLFLFGLVIASFVLAAILFTGWAGMLWSFKAFRQTTLGQILSQGWYWIKQRSCPVVSVVELRETPAA